VNTELNKLSKSDRGMALPMVFLIGLVLTGTAVTMIAKSQQQRGTAVAQSNASKSGNFAELGVNQYLDFLNNNRILLTYPACVGTLTSTGACPDTGDTKSWANVASAGILPVAPEEGNTCQVSSNLNQTPATQIARKWANSGSSGWKPIQSGQYRLVSYQYTPKGAAGTAPGEGKLVIEGRSLAQGDDPTRNASTRLAVTIPVNISLFDPSGDSFPGVWAGDFKISNNPTVNANVWDTHACLPNAQAMPSANVAKLPVNPLVVVSDTNNGNKELYQLGDAAVLKEKKQSFPELPNHNQYVVPTGVHINQLPCPYGENLNESFPRNTDVDKEGRQYGAAPENATYLYRVCRDATTGTSLQVNHANLTLGRSGMEKLVFYVDGNINVAALGNITVLPPGNSKTIFYVAPEGWVNIESNANLGLISNPTAIQFYIYAKDGGMASSTMTPQTTSKAQSVYIHGNGSFYAFVFAPFANVNVGSTGDVAGALWAKSYESSGNGKVFQSIFSTEELEIVEQPFPTLGEVSKWEKVANKD
jgi:hypothetical protein